LLTRCRRYRAIPRDVRGVVAKERERCVRDQVVMLLPH
jgi:hypothetical protein